MALILTVRLVFEYFYKLLVLLKPMFFSFNKSFQVYNFHLKCINALN